MPFKFNSVGVLPDVTNSYDIGSNTLRYRNVYATTLYGDGSNLTNISATSSTSATSAATLTTARLIGGVSFNGSADINLPGVNTAGNQNTTGSAATLTNSRTLWGQSFNGSANVSGNLTSVGNITGTGAVTLTATTGTLGLVATGANIITATTNAIERLRIGSDGIITVTGNIVPEANNTRNIGTALLKYNTVYATLFSGTAVEAFYADLAENYLGDASYEPGTVLVFGGDFEVTVTNKKSDHRVAGVVTTNPAQLMNSQLQGDHVIGVALQGRVPCKVIGKVEKGDILVTSAITGYAIVDNDAPAGRIIGKSLEKKITGDKGIVEVVVGKH
jgi:hypothetical protein